jgi:excisionase family DNA binding protein
MTTATDSENLTRREAAEFLRVGSTTLWKLDKERVLCPVRVGSRCLYRREDLEKFLNRLAKQQARASR